jgi:glycerol-1-phosphate dehydrogenase [NAD(P)+]
MKMTIDFTGLLADTPCECGRVHRSEVKKIIMEEGALAKLPSVVSEMGVFKNIVMICDTNTYEAAGKRVETLLPLADRVMLDPHHLHANERAVGEVEKRLIGGADLLCAVGSGTVHDITRYVAYHRGIPFVSVPTAASVDGYVSNVAAMTWNGAKKTLTACAPTAMVADLSVIAAAPMRLTASGVGDMLGKYTALFDWKVGKLLSDEYYCERIVELVEQALVSVKKSVEKLNNRDVDAIGALMYGLVLSGIAMQHTGISRPASGAEHHISHFIEMTVPVERCDALHGEKVGVGLLLAARLYHDFAAMSDSDAARLLSDYKKADDSYVREQFGPLAEEIFKENERDCAEGITANKLLSVLPELRRGIAAIPSVEELSALLRACGACTSLEEIGLSDAELIPTLCSAAPLVRNRLTLMRLLRGMRGNA